MDVRKLLTEHDIWLKRSRDQHFLVDNEILDYEIELAELKKEDVVLEIGAGIGNLTEKIARKAHVIALEKDKRFLPFLEQLADVEIVNSDAVKIVKKLDFNKVISNIPYSISQKLLIGLLKKKWDIAVLVVQKEFARKLKKDKLGIVVDDCTEIRIINGIPPEAFFPKGVGSSIIVLRQKAQLDSGFWEFLNKAHRYRNKNVKNVFPNCNESIANVKIHQLPATDLKRLYKVVTA